MNAYDLHIHSRRSNDSLSSARAIVATAGRRGLAGIAVTDHDTIQGGLDAAAIAPDGLLVVVGAEYYTDVGDIVGLFLHEEVRSREALRVVEEIHAQGGFAFLPHPLRSHPPIPPDVLDAVDAYETLNSRAGWFHPEEATTEGQDWTPLATKPAIGCSDAHLLSEIGRGRTLIDGPATVENLRARLREGRIEAHGTTGPSRNFYLSQVVKMLRTGDLGPFRRRARRLVRRVLGS